MDTTILAPIMEKLDRKRLITTHSELVYSGKGKTCIVSTPISSIKPLEPKPGQVTSEGCYSERKRELRKQQIMAEIEEQRKLLRTVPLSLRSEQLATMDRTEVIIHANQAKAALQQLAACDKLMTAIFETKGIHI